MLNIELQTSTPLTPFQNGLIERAWCIVKEQLKAIALSDKLAHEMGQEVGEHSLELQ